MKKVYLPVVIFFILALGACSKSEETIDVVKFQPLDYQIFLFSNRENRTIEQEYMEAILILQEESEQQEILWNKQIINQEQVPDIDVKQYPSLIIFKNGELIKEIYGATEKNVIISEVNEVMSILQVNNLN